MSIQLADRSIKYPIGVCENLLVKVSKFIFLIDFVVLEMDEDELVLIILGRPFLATTWAVIDVHEGKLSLRVVPKKAGMTVVKNEKNELILQRTVSGWRVCIDYRKLNNMTRKDNFPLPFIDQMLECLAEHEYYCFLDGFLGYFQIPIALEDQEKTTFTCPYDTFAYKRMPFGLCNVHVTFQCCMTAICQELIEDAWKYS
ncbi:reverse transcriptase domain-containing protein [Tanacetum coccineum]